MNGALARTVPLPPNLVTRAVGEAPASSRLGMASRTLWSLNDMTERPCGRERSSNAIADWTRSIVRGEHNVTEQADAQTAAALAAAKARQAIAARIEGLLPQVEDETSAQIVLNLAEAYAQLATEPPRVRTT